jgi:hypothetical protein
MNKDKVEREVAVSPPGGDPALLDTRIINGIIIHLLGLAPEWWMASPDNRA